MKRFFSIIFGVQSNGNRLYVWKTQDEVYQQQCVGQHGRDVRICVMFLGMCDILRKVVTSTNI